MPLSKLRDKIDAVDKQLIDLLAERLRLVGEVGVVVKGLDHLILHLAEERADSAAGAAEVGGLAADDLEICLLIQFPVVAIGQLV